MNEEIAESQMQEENANALTVENEGDSSSEITTTTPEKQSDASEKQQGTLPVKKGRPLLNRLEGVIEKGYKEFWQVGEALWEIREKHLYVERYSGSDYETFSAYLEGRWGYRSRGYQLMEASRIRRLMIDELEIRNPDTIYASERQYRENVGLLKLEEAGRLQELKETLPERKELTAEAIIEKTQALLPTRKSKRSSKSSKHPDVQKRQLEKKLDSVKNAFTKKIVKLRLDYPGFSDLIDEWLRGLATPTEGNV